MYLIAANDFRLTLKSRGIALFIFALPIVFMFFFGATFKGQSASPKAGLALEDRDGGFVSKALVAELRKEPLDIIDTLRAGVEAPRTLVIPEGFSEKALSRAKTALILRRNKDSNLEAGEAVSTAVARCIMRVVSHLVEMESDELAKSGKGIAGGGSGFAVKGDSVRGSLFELARGNPRLLNSIRSELDSLTVEPPNVTVVASSAGTAKRMPTGFQASVPGILVQFVLMTLVFTGIAITVERNEGVLRRFAYAPVGRVSVLLGKLFGRMGVAIVQIVFLLAFGKLVFHISLGGSPGALALLMIMFAFCCGAFGILFGALFRNPEQVSAISVITTLTMSALGGCWWSIELVSRPFKVIALLFPTGWTMDGMHKLISFGYGMKEAAPDMAVLAAFGLAFIFLASWKLKWTQ